jgi:hypothetical protein
LLKIQAIISPVPGSNGVIRVIRRFEKGCFYLQLLPPANLLPSIGMDINLNVDTLSHDHFRCQVLDTFKLLLDNLPRQLPLTTGNSAFSTFLDFKIDPDLLEKTGCEVSALSEQLKGVFGWSARTTGDGIVVIDKRGAAVSAMHTVLAGFWERHPKNNILRKWIFDISKGAEKAYQVHNVAVCHHVS